MIKILSIGNSFSVNAQAFAGEIARAAGEEILLGNLYIGGCSLERHWQNVESGEAAYAYRRNCQEIGRCDIRTGLLDEDWDYVTMQQASHFSGLYETYQPFLNRLSEAVRALLPRAEQVIHQTWAYEIDSAHPGFASYDGDQQKMHFMLRDAYRRAAQSIGGARIIPCGDAVQLARAMKPFDLARGGKSLCADGYHLSRVLGQYIAGAVWFEFFTGKSVLGNAFVPCAPLYVGRDRAAEAFEPKFAPDPLFAPTDEELVAAQRAAHAAMHP